ncbi:MAG: FAD-binding protein [Deltaproteobacteria bacterium]|nr:FAD-binding protein [Deltaproteobacteria bacterium]
MDSLRADVLVIGAGAAGIRAALAASEEGADVVLMAMEKIGWAGSTFSPVSEGWGIQGLVSKERTHENMEAFYEDIIRVGLGRCDPVLVRILVEESGPRINDLINLGIRFSKDSRGHYIRVKGCFSQQKRAFLAHDIHNIRDSFLTALRSTPVKILDGYAVDLITTEQACWGAICLLSSGGFLRIDSKATILATGGGAGIYRDNLVGEDQIGDGYALAHAAGAQLMNMEFIQFMLGGRSGKHHPYVALAGLDQGGIIRDTTGRDFLEVAIPDRGVRSISVKDREQHAPFSCRDLSCLVDIGIARSVNEGRKLLWKGGPGDDSLPLHHFAHAFNGGIRIDESGQSTVSGLYACGEVAGGPHGADRIGGCMITATQVFGYRAGRAAARRAIMMRRASFPRANLSDGTRFLSRKNNHTNHDIVEVIDHVKCVMGRYAMVLRNANGLKKCKNRLNECGMRLEEMKEKNTLSPQKFFETRNMIQTANLIIRSASMRKESRGAHYREDFPATTVTACLPNHISNLEE